MNPLRIALGFALLTCVSSCGGGDPAPPEAEASDTGGGEDHAHHGHRSDHLRHDFSDVERFEAMFESPERDAWQRPDDVVRMLGLSSGQVAADLGAGTGYFVGRLAAAVAPGGQVIALDTEPAMVEHIRARAEREAWAGVEARVVEPDDPGLAAESVDRILIVDTWHHIEDRSRYAARLGEALRAEGELWIVDFTLESPHGPPPAHRLTAEAVIAELEAAGLDAAVVEEADLAHQWVVRARRR